MASTMATCFENINIPPCIWFRGGEKRNSIASIAAGFFFFLGWWMLIDAASVHPGKIQAGYHMCGIIGTLALVMVNSVSNAMIRGEVYEGSCLSPTKAKVWLFLGFFLGFSAVIAACGILFIDFVGPKAGIGVGLFLQNAFIFIASLIYKFGRSEDLWSN